MLLRAACAAAAFSILRYWLAWTILAVVRLATLLAQPQHVFHVVTILDNRYRIRRLDKLYDAIQPPFIEKTYGAWSWRLFCIAIVRYSAKFTPGCALSETV
ncbi:MAG: hypothetical protein OXQ89_23105 [Rhodospirillaceae bacterium]|nr:hypothetical protein [Rhodospirillaceae bacterium]MDE0000640.1 hypothetical protein [Rhodospirillaceae bacterium]MDE0361330.1 hypothetical protein [Rhodospirillaceae bacterium]